MRAVAPYVNVVILMQLVLTRFQIDYHALHFYGTSEQDLITYIQNWHNTFGKPIMLTEFACQVRTIRLNSAFLLLMLLYRISRGGPQCSASQVQNFYGNSIKWMESQDYVTAYFAYGALISENGVNDLDALMTPGGEPTALGEQYINVGW